MVGYFSPKRAIARIGARATMEQITALTGGNAGYQGGKLNRLTRGRFGSNINENAVPREQIERLRWKSWELFRNNPHARKIVRSLEAKVIGRGLRPQSQATRADGTPHVEFRRRAQEIWRRVQPQLDSRGLPGRGGQSGAELQRLALRTVILGGEVLFRFRPVAPAKARRKGLVLPLQLQMIHPARLVERWLYGQSGTAAGAAPNNTIFRGIEVTPDGERAAYWLYDRHPSEPLQTVTDMEPKRIDAAEIGHLYVAEDVDQLRGVPWFAPAILNMDYTGDYQFNELQASAQAACVVLGIRRPRGAGSFGAQVPEEWELTDNDGNPITAMQPGMVVDLGQDGEITGFNPARPNTNAEAWINAMIRSTATALPGVKGSTLTGDYRNSSFSSERAADNDQWPELEGVQDWVALGFCQPLYVEIMRTAALAGMFDDVIRPAEFLNREQELLAATWQGPVARSINPADDAKAASLRVQGAQSSPQREAAMLGADWRELLREQKEFTDYVAELGLPEELANNVLGLDFTDELKDETPADATNKDGSATEGTEDGEDEGDGEGDGETGSGNKKGTEKVGTGA